MASARLRLPRVLVDLASGGRSGVLRAQASSAKKQLVLDRGTLAFAESNQPGEHLARITAGLGLLDRPGLREVVSLMKTGKNSEEAVAAVLHSGPEAPHSGPDALRRCLCEQVLVVLASLLGRDGIDLKFFPGEHLIKNRTSLGLDVPETLLGAARRAASGRIVPMPPGLLEGTILPGSAYPGGPGTFPLLGAESYACLRAGDAIPARELLPLMPPAETPAEEVLHALYILGLVESADARGAAPPPAGDRDDPSADLLAIGDLLARFEHDGPCGILSVDPGAGAEAIQDAYHRLARRYHPDRFHSEELSDSLRSQVEQVFSCINTAYATLRDPAARAQPASGGGRKAAGEGAPARSGAAGAGEAAAVEALFRQGCRSLSGGDPEKAAKELRTCVHLCPDNARYHHFLGLAESGVVKLHKSAEQHFMKAIELEPASLDSRVALAELYLKVRLPRRAAAVLEEVLRWDPENPAAARLQARMGVA